MFIILLDKLVLTNKTHPFFTIDVQNRVDVHVS